MSYVDIFNNSPVVPSDVSYVRITLSSTTSVQLSWSTFATDNNVAARIIELNPTISGTSIKLPDATLVGKGQDILFRNVGSTSVTVLLNNGSTLLTILNGEAKYAYLTDNSTAAGTWTVIAFGVGVGTLDASQLAGLGLKAISATLNTAYSTSITSSGFMPQLSDRAKLYVFNGGAVTLSLQSALAYGNDWFILISNLGAGAVTVDPPGAELVDGAATISINPGESTILITDGLNFYTVGRGRSVQFSYTQLVKDVSGSSNVTLTSAEASNKILKFIGTLTGSINVIVPNVVSQYIIDNRTTGAFTLTVKTAAGAGVVVPQNNRVIVYCDGTDVLQAITVAVATGGFPDGTAAAPSISFINDTDTGFYRAAANTIGFATNGIVRLTIDTDSADFTVPVTFPGQDSNALAFAIALG